MADLSYELVARIPTIDEYRALRRLSGLSEKSEAAAARGLPATLFAVVILHEDKAVGMGRVVGDGGTALQLVDIAVLPQHQVEGSASASSVRWWTGSGPRCRRQPMSV